MAVTRVEIADHIHNAFGDDRMLTANDLLSSARSNGARPEVLRTLERLPGIYSDMRELWPDLPGVPVASAAEMRTLSTARTGHGRA